MVTWIILCPVEPALYRMNMDDLELYNIDLGLFGFDFLSSKMLIVFTMFLHIHCSTLNLALGVLLSLFDPVLWKNCSKNTYNIT